jgi:putative intracellular protease/amidase
MKRYDEEFAVLLEGINGMQAGMAASLLEDAGIPCMQHGPDFDMAEFGSAAHAMLRGTSLLVPHSALQRAQEELDRAGWGVTLDTEDSEPESSADPAASGMLDMRAPWKVGILIFDGVEVLDFAGPFEVFSRTRLVPGLDSRRSEEDAPLQVFTVAESSSEVVATGGLRIVPQYDFASAPAIDLLVVPGGFGTRPLLENENVLAWIVKTAAAAQRVSSVCTGALLLAKAGLLSGKRATTHWGAYDTLASVDDTIEVDREARVVEDGVITSAGVAAGIDMAFAVVESLFGRQVADETAHYIEYPRHVSRP